MKTRGDNVTELQYDEVRRQVAAAFGYAVDEQTGWLVADVLAEMGRHERWLLNLDGDAIGDQGKYDATVYDSTPDDDPHDDLPAELAAMHIETSPRRLSK